MNEEEKENARPSAAGRAVVGALFALLMMLIAVSPVIAWFASEQGLLAYAPVSNPQSFYIGAGHIEFEGENGAEVNQFEDIRYLYLNGIDVTNESVDHYDYVFCVYGKNVGRFKLQLAYTTNNQFTYEIFNAVEDDETGDVAYETHGDTPAVYYYTATGEALSGGFLNAKTVDGQTLGKNATDEAAYAEDEKFHKKTYGAYTDVDKYAEPLYWQTSGTIETGNPRGNFVNYFILRVNTNGKAANDRETDLICIAAKSVS